MLATRAIADRLVAVLAAIPGVHLARKGIPESQGVYLEADVTLGSQTAGRKTQGLTYIDTRFLVTFSYRLDGNESAAEDALMDVVDALLAALWADQTLGGTCQGVEVDTSGADTPDYQPRAGREFREYPVVVMARQYGTYEVTP